MDISVRYLYLEFVLLAVICGAVLGDPQSSGIIESSRNSGSNSNPNALKVAGLLSKIYNLLGEPAEGLSECQFPFIYKGVTYNKCTTDHDYYGMFWCSTRTNDNHEHVYNTWRHCRLADGVPMTDVSLADDDSSECECPKKCTYYTRTGECHYFQGGNADVGKRDCPDGLQCIVNVKGDCYSLNPPGFWVFKMWGNCSEYGAHSTGISNVESVCCQPPVECACEYQDHGLNAGCVITRAAPRNKACCCNISPAIGPNLCDGTITNCKNETSPNCIDPGTWIPSCKQAEGNCNCRGYQFS